MKRTLFAVLLILSISTASFSGEFVAGGKTYSTFGDYKIEKADKPLSINGEDVKTFVISYQNSPMKVTVAIMNGKKCKNYVVLSDKLAVEYVCNSQYFGVQLLDKSLAIDGITTSEAALNKTEYFHQKLLTEGMKGEVENTQLIAAYFPLLINQEDLASN